MKGKEVEWSEREVKRKGKGMEGREREWKGSEGRGGEWKCKERNREGPRISEDDGKDQNHDSQDGEN